MPSFDGFVINRVLQWLCGLVDVELHDSVVVHEVVYGFKVDQG